MKNKEKRMTAALPIAIALSALLVTSCATTQDFVTGERTRNFYSVNDDIKMGNATFEEMKAQLKKDGVAEVSTNRAEVDRVNRIANRIFTATGQQDTFHFEATLFESEVVNAFAVPGGKIAVFSGIWDPKKGLVKDDDELAAVIAHEVAHVTCRHSTEAMTRQMPAQLALMGLGIFAATQEDQRWNTAAQSAFIMYNGLVVPKYSRTDEFEADSVSMQYMARAGFDPTGAVRLWERAYQKEGQAPGYMSILSTHPSNKARYDALRRQLPSALALREASSAVDAPQVPRNSDVAAASGTKPNAAAQANAFSGGTPAQGGAMAFTAAPPSKAMPPAKANPPAQTLPPPVAQPPR